MGRVRSTVIRLNKRLTIQLAATLLAASTLLSSALGFFRDRILNSMYLDTYKVGIDAYTAAFTVPDFMFFILVSGALSVTFIPVFNQRLGSGNKKSAWQLSTSMINFMAMITLIASVLIIIFAEPLLQYIIAPGLSESGMALAVSMMRVIAVNPFLFAIATVIASMQQAIGRFTFYALAPTIYNVGIIIGALFFTNGIYIFGHEVFDGGIMGVALGVVLGSVMQLVVSSMGLIGLGFDYNFKIYWKNKGFRKVLGLLPARSFDQGMDYAMSLVEVNLTSRMSEGTVRAFQQATALHFVPINLIGVAISTAAFPKMTEFLSAGRMDLFKTELQKLIRIIIWLSLPVVLVTFFARGYVVNFINPHGDNGLIAGILAMLVLAILFRSVYHIAARSFYAQQDTKTPLYISFVAIGLNIFMAIWFTFELELGALGLAMAQSIVAGIEIFILFIIMSRRIPKLFDTRLIGSLVKMFSATGFTALVVYGMVLWFPLEANDSSFFSTFPKFCLIVSVSLISYVLISKLFQVEESTPVINKAKTIIFGRFVSSD